MKRSIIGATAIMILVLLLAGAAFVGGRLLSDDQQPEPMHGEIMMGPPGSDGAVVSQRVELQLESSDLIPEDPPDAVGIFVRREDDSIVIGTGNLMANMEMSQGGQPQLEIDYDGPELQVILTRDTQIFRDDTAQQFGAELPSGTVQQVVNPGSLDELGTDNSVSVWGQRRGDRLIADTLLYDAPMIMTREMGP